MSIREFTAAEFVPAQPPQALGKDEIHLWFYPRWEGSPRAVAESPVVRALLASYLGCALADLLFERDRHGKPRLADAGLQFNVSHSAGAVLVGVSRELPLGVDLELSRRSRPVLDLARRYFDPGETTALMALPQARQQAAFLGLWSCKEALLKAQGRGIAFGLHRVVFALDAATGAVTQLQAIDGEAAADWSIQRLCPVAGAAAALAWHGPECSVRTFQARPTAA
jgi:4'-phosphopantetheinyl transferase